MKAGGVFELLMEENPLEIARCTVLVFDPPKALELEWDYRHPRGGRDGQRASDLEGAVRRAAARIPEAQLGQRMPAGRVEEVESLRVHRQLQGLASGDRKVAGHAYREPRPFLG